jgi:hypothetical protein
MASIMPFDSFLRTSLRKKLLKSYRSFEILSEADLQAYVWMHANRFLRTLPDGASKFSVSNQLYCGDLDIHPDLVVRRFSKIWICVELKEAGRIAPTAIQKDRERLNDTRHKLKAHRGYLIYLSRHSNPKLQVEDRYPLIRSIIISMQDELPPKDFAKWNAEFKRLSKYRLPPELAVG